MVKHKADRASQFAPFDALKGFREALREKERIPADRVELSEEQKELLNCRLHQIRHGMIVTVTFFCDGAYEKKTGMVSGFDPASRNIRIVQHTISFDDICDISGDFDGIS